MFELSFIQTLMTYYSPPGYWLFSIFLLCISAFLTYTRNWRTVRCIAAFILIGAPWYLLIQTDYFTSGRLFFVTIGSVSFGHAILLRCPHCKLRHKKLIASVAMIMSFLSVFLCVLAIYESIATFRTFQFGLVCAPFVITALVVMPVLISVSYWLTMKIGSLFIYVFLHTAIILTALIEMSTAGFMHGKIIYHIVVCIGLATSAIVSPFALKIYTQKLVRRILIPSFFIVDVILICALLMFFWITICNDNVL